MPSSSTQQHQYGRYRLSEQCKRLAATVLRRTVQEYECEGRNSLKMPKNIDTPHVSGQKKMFDLKTVTDVGRTRTYAPEGN
jgi:hypothetical protein